MKSFTHILLIIFFSQLAYASHMIADDINCTLPDAIRAANSDTLVGGCDGSITTGPHLIVLKYNYVAAVADAVFSTNLYGSYAALPDITSEITIMEGSGLTVSIERDSGLNCNNADQVDEFRLLQILGGGQLTLDGIDILNGCADAGAGVLILDGILNSNNVTFISNTARFATSNFNNSGGGALGFFDASAVGQIQTTTFQNNSSVAQGVLTPEGGAIKIQMANTISIVGSNFTNNQAMSDVTTPQFARGGALFVNSTTLNVTDSTFTANQVTGKISWGGAVYLGSNIILNQFSSSQFIGNQVISSVADAQGGAMYLSLSGALFSDLIFRQNKSISADKTNGNGSLSLGGALYNGGVNNTLSNVYFFENQAKAGAGIVGGQGIGGAVYLESGMSLINVTFENNQALGGTGLAGNGGHGLAGAVYACGLAFSSGVTFSGNKAIGGNSNSNSGGDAQGGAMFVDCGPANVHNTTFANNQVIAGLGNLLDGMALSGGIHVNDTVVNIGSSLFDNNTTDIAGVINGSDCYNTTGIPTALISLGYNLIPSANNCDFSTATDQVGVSASLLPLADNGCASPLPDGTCLSTHGIAISSNALDQGSCTSSGVTTDARGFNRPYDEPMTNNADDACDVGAFEYVDASVNPFAIFKDGFE